MIPEAFRFRELPKATVDDLYSRLNEEVSQIVEGWLPKATLLERNSLGNVVVRDLVVEFPAGPRKVDGLALQQAAAEIVKDLGVDFSQGKRVKTRREPKPESNDYWRIETTEFETKSPNIVCLKEERYDAIHGNPEGMTLAVENKQPKPIFQRIKRGILGR